MGDRTTVEITVLALHAEQVFETLKNYQHFPNNWDFEDVQDDDDYAYSYEDKESKLELTLFILNEVNYANVDSESADLCNLGIAHNVRWDHGCNYSAGRNYFRFNEDGTGKSAIGLNDEDVPTINAQQLLEKLDSISFKEAKQYIKEIVNEYSEPSWMNQQEYGALYVQLKEQNSISKT